MYKLLGGERVISDVREQGNLLGRRLDLLVNVSEGLITAETMTRGQAESFHEILLDSIALQLATGNRRSVFDSFRVDNPKLLGGSKYRLAKLRESDEAQLDWHFQILVQAAASAKGLGLLKDLRDDPRFSNSRVCDYAINGNNDKFELLECKRIHPEGSLSLNPVQDVITKIRSRLPSAIDQLERTSHVSHVFGNSLCVKHALIDISGYSGGQEKVSSHSVNLVLGGFQQNDICAIESAVASNCIGLDRLTLCWYTPIWIDGKIRAILQQTKSIFQSTVKVDLFNYEGWTVEGYPLSQAEYREFRVLSRVKSLDSIAISYENMSNPQTFWTTGPEEKL
jgi:hypothetical protein